MVVFKDKYLIDDFGEGSFDKGLLFKIPPEYIFRKSTRSNYSARIVTSSERWRTVY